MNRPYKMFISAGELSGDIHAGKVIKHLKVQLPDLHITAIGGDYMADQGAELIYHIRDTSFMGFIEVIKHLPFIKKIWNNTIKHLKQTKPDLILLVDYPGFNLRLAKAASKMGIPCIYYISPTVWAWHKSRVKTIRKYVKKMLCILPFEEDWYKDYNVNATYIGHPLMDKEIPKQDEIPFSETDKIISLFPGSRDQEIEKHLDIMIHSSELIHQSHPEIKVAVAMAPDIDFSSYQSKYPYKWIKWIKGKNDELMKKSKFLVMASGTASLEATIHETPMVVIYITSPFTFWLGKKLVNISYISLANLIGNQEGIKELLQNDATPENIFKEAEKILSNPDYDKKVRKFLHYIKKKLGSSGASKNVSKIIIDELALESNSK